MVVWEEGRRGGGAEGKGLCGWGSLSSFLLLFAVFVWNILFGLIDRRVMF